MIYNDLVITCMEPTIRGIVEKIQYHMEKITDDPYDPKKFLVEKYLKLLEEIYRYAEI